MPWPVRKFVRALAVVLTGSLVLLGTSYMLIYSGQDAQASIYWSDGGASDAAYIDALSGTNCSLVHDTYFTLNSSDGYFAVMRSDLSPKDLLEKLKEQFGNLPSENVIVGYGQRIQTLMIRSFDRVYGFIIFFDEHVRRTMVLSAVLPIDFLHGNGDPLLDVPGVDPVPELRPLASRRAMCLEMPSMTMAAYKSMAGELASFYGDTARNGTMRMTSITGSRSARLPNNGDLFFFDRGSQLGFVIYESDPGGNGSYSLVCAQTQ